jgi:hypothetical protein
MEVSGHRGGGGTSGPTDIGSGQCTLTLHQVDQARTDFAIIEDELEAIHTATGAEGPRTMIPRLPISGLSRLAGAFVSAPPDGGGAAPAGLMSTVSKG